jgi:hypothetical protein
MSILKLLQKDCLILVGSLGNLLIQRLDKSFLTLHIPPNELYEVIEELKQELGFIEVPQSNPGVCLVNPSVIKYFRYIHYLERGVVNCEIFFGKGQSEYFVREFGDVLSEHIPQRKLPDWIVQKGTLKNKK